MATTALRYLSASANQQHHDDATIRPMKKHPHIGAAAACAASLVLGFSNEHQ
jgi:hypothetical protein